MSLATIVNLIILAFEAVLFARVVLSWVPHDRDNPVVGFIYLITDPPVLLCREIIETVGRRLGADVRTLPLDFSPLLAFLIIDLVLRRIVLLVLH